MKSTARFSFLVKTMELKPIVNKKTLLLLFVFLVCQAGTGKALQVYPRIFSPNGDGWNDKVLFQIDNPALLPVKGEVFDISGAKVGDMKPGPIVDVSLVWDGKKDDAVVPGGIYIYQIEVGGSVMTGTVIVAQ